MSEKLDELLGYLQELDPKKATHTCHVTYDPLSKIHAYEIQRTEVVGRGALGGEGDEDPILYAVRRMLGRILQDRDREVARTQQELTDMSEALRVKTLKFRALRRDPWPKHLVGAIEEEVKKAT